MTSKTDVDFKMEANRSFNSLINGMILSYYRVFMVIAENSESYCPVYRYTS